MKILVCISQVPDTTTRVKFSQAGTELDVAGIQWVINPWDELALSRALELKEKNATIVESVGVVIVGLSTVEATLRKALAMGADVGYRVDCLPSDAYVTAKQISSVVKNYPHELIIAGVESADYNSGSVGGMIAELSQMPSISGVSAIELNAGVFTFSRERDGVIQVVVSQLPVVVVGQKGLATEPRIPSMRGVMSARTKTINVLQPDASMPMVEYESFELPKPKAGCKMFTEDQLDQLIEELHAETKVI